MDVLASIRSMTGHGAAVVTRGAASVSVEIRTVNHRWLEVRPRVPPELADHAAAVEDLVRRLLVRGRIDVGMRIDGERAGIPRLDVARARAAFEELSALRDVLAPAEPVPLSLLAAVPGLFANRETCGPASLREAALAATREACEAVMSMRAEEGAALAADLTLRAAEVERLVDAVAGRSPLVLASARTRLEERLGRLLESRPHDPIRLEQELALIADRSDICEECTRLKSHVAQLVGLFARPEPALGRRLDFLLQEMARESNTLGQKSADVEIARAVIELKVEIERMREQAQNIL